MRVRVSQKLFVLFGLWSLLVFLV